MSYVNVLIIWLLVCVAGCHSVKNTSDEQVVVEDDSPKIIFLDYLVKKSTNDKPIVKLTNKIIVDGKIKKKAHHHGEAVHGDYLCVLLNGDKQILDETIVSNPFVEDIEYVDEEGKLQRKHIEKDSAEFSIRMQLHPDTKFISVDEIGEQNIRHSILGI